MAELSAPRKRPSIAPQPAARPRKTKPTGSLGRLEEIVNEINQEIQTRYFFYKPDFVDYWKGF